MTTFDSGLFGSQADLVERCLAELQAKTAGHDGGWGLGRSDWAADLDEGTLTFTNDRFRAVCRIQVIGTYDTLDGSWLWGWDHPSVPEALAHHAELVREFARRHGLQALLTPKLSCSEADIWAFGALATHLANAQGAYRGPAGTTLVMMTFDEVRLQAP